MFNVLFWRRQQPWWERYGVGFEMKMPSFEMPRFRAPEMPNVSMPHVSMPHVPYYHQQSGFDWGRWWPYMLGAALVGAAFAFFYSRGFNPVNEYVFRSEQPGNGASHREPVGTYSGTGSSY